MDYFFSKFPFGSFLLLGEPECSLLQNPSGLQFETFKKGARTEITFWVFLHFPTLIFKTRPYSKPTYLKFSGMAVSDTGNLSEAELIAATRQQRILVTTSKLALALWKTSISWIMFHVTSEVASFL